MRKILYLGTNRLYINKNMEVVTSLFKSAGQTDFYGPGYSDLQELEGGVRFFVEKNGPYDFIFIDAVVLFSDLDTGNDPLNGSYNYFPSKDFYSSFKDMVSFFLDTGGTIPHKIFYPNFDPYNMSQQLKERLEHSGAFLFTRDHKFWSKKEDMKNLEHETFQNNVNDNWVNYIYENKQRVISFHGTVVETDFRYHPIESKKNDVGVFGVEYYSRRVAINQLKQSDLMVSHHASGYRRKIRSLLFRAFQSREFLSWYQESFLRSIEDTKMCYTCGSALGYAIRKFVEIPSRGSLLICSPFTGYSHSGYKDGVNFISINPEDILDITSDLMKNTTKVQGITKAGQNMVQELHSFTARLKQLNRMLSKIEEKTFEGSEWIDGSLKIFEK